MTVDEKMLRTVSLTMDEYKQIVQRLGREPNMVELGMFGVMWSEHCGYKNSKPLLKLFPNSGDRVLVKAGEENAGAVDIGDGLAIVMKMESHNHPSAVEPFQGAATGVGGIVRDIFTMGARPIALLDSLRFGPLNMPRNRFLLGGVVSGISWYGNCIGVPTVGGEIYFAPPYSGNPLVNVMCVGLVEKSRLARAKASGIGNPVLYVGSATGRDGIHGASFASLELSEDSEESRPAVQVGNPFMEKLLIEACLESLKTGRVVALQDMGAAGLTGSSCEMASSGGHGIEIDIQLVPRREEGMTSYEVMLSESQERELLIVEKGHEDEIVRILNKWGLNAVAIGQVTGDGVLRVKEGATTVAEIPSRLLTEPPVYFRQGIKPEWLTKLQNLDLSTVPLPRIERRATDRQAVAGARQRESHTATMGAGITLDTVLLKLLASPNIASKRYVYSQYDYQIQTNTVIEPGGDAAVLRIKGTRKAIALSSDCNGKLCYLEPFAGGAIAVAEATRNLVCSGAEPLAVTDCLNFGNPEKPEIYYQLEQAVKGMAEACRVLGIPVISGNVSLYNETEGVAIYPTPTVGVVGLLEDVDQHCTIAFKKQGDLVVLLGQSPEWESEYDRSSLAGSEYLELIHGIVGGEPTIDLQIEKRVQRCCLQAIRSGVIKSAHDCSDGGVAVTLAESCMAGKIGFTDWNFEAKGRIDAALFGEGQSRIVVSIEPGDLSKLMEIARRNDVPLQKLGTVGGNRFTIGNAVDLEISQLADAWENGLELALK